MPIAFDVQSTDTFATSGTSFTIAMTIGSLTNGILQAGVFWGSGTDLLSGVTWNGVAMTRAVVNLNHPTGNSTAIYTLANPASGTHNLVASFSSSVTGVAHGASYSGAAQTVTPDSSATNQAASATTFALTTTTVADNSWLFGMVREDVGGLAAGANTTFRGGWDPGGYTSADTNSAQTPAGSKSLNFTNSAANWGGCIISFAPFVAVSSNLLLLGVG